MQGKWKYGVPSYLDSNNFLFILVHDLFFSINSVLGGEDLIILQTFIEPCYIQSTISWLKFTKGCGDSENLFLVYGIGKDMGDFLNVQALVYLGI